VDEIKRTTGPQTMNGRRWEVQLSASPSDEWLALFRASGEPAARALPHRLEFAGAAAVFKADTEEVEQWIEAIDKWIASTNARYLIIREQARRERFDRLEADTKEGERVQALNDRFKNL
jgi:hypothetical protein